MLARSSPEAMDACVLNAVKLAELPPDLMRPDLERRLPLSGTRFKSLVGYSSGGVSLIGFVGYLGKYSAYLAKCHCGSLFVTRGPQFVSRPAGCGCALRTHGMSKSNEYEIYKGMFDRCNNPNNPGYHRYGGRGIRVCERWSTFENFFADMGYRPSEKHSLDRFPDNDGDYSPDNCRWATDKEQAQNKGDWNRWLELDGERMVMADWADRVGVTRERMRQRVNKCEANGVDPIEAITTPPGECMPSFSNYHERYRIRIASRNAKMLKEQWYDGNVHVLRKGKDWAKNISCEGLRAVIQTEAEARGGKCKFRILRDHVMFVFESNGAESAVA